jgi:hypothetical protein
MKPKLRLILLSLLVCSLFPIPAFAQDQQVYQDDFMRVVAKKGDIGATTAFAVCAQVAAGAPVSLVAVDLVLKDFFDAPLAVPEVLLFWQERPKAFCNQWTARNVRKWEIGSVIALMCAGGQLSVTHSSGPPQEIPAGKVERIYQDIRRLAGFRNC